MYFPYFRCKQFELIAIRESIPAIKQGCMVPVLEPVRKNLVPLKKCLEKLQKEEIKFILIINPKVGELKSRQEILQTKIIEDNFIDNEYCFLGFIIKNDTKNSQIKCFLTDNNTYKKCLIHSYSMENENKLKTIIHNADDLEYNMFDLDQCSEQYIEGLATHNNVAFQDDFKARKKNSDYPPDELFSALCFNYCKKDFIGYGDFLIVGEEYSETGGPAHVVTIHFTYPRDDREIRIKHFSSHSDKELPINPAGKFAEAIHKLKKFLDTSGQFIKNDLHYQANKEFMDLFNKSHYPGLGSIKKISMKHHMEVMAKI